MGSFGAGGGGGGGGGGGLTGGGGGAGAPSVPSKGDTQTVKRDADTKTSCAQAGEPVVFSTGNEVLPQADFTSTGSMGLSLTRTYNHYWNGIGIFGRRWLSNYDYKLLFTTHDPASSCYTRPGNTPCNPVGKPIWALRPDGRLIKFNYSTTPQPGWYEDKPASIAKIIKTGSTYTLHSEDHTVEVYDASGFPSVIDNQQGVGWTFSYDANHYLQRVTASSGRHVDFGWSNGLLTTVTDPAGNVYHYDYERISVSADTMAKTQGMSPMMLPPLQPGQWNDNPPVPPATNLPSLSALLTSATQPATQGGAPATVTTYHYEDARFETALTGTSINGSRYSTITYDANAMAVQTQMAGGSQTIKLAYTLSTAGTISSVTITNPLEKKTTYKFNASSERTAVVGGASTHCPERSKALVYDANGYLEQTTDFDSHVTKYTYAANGELQQEIRGAGTSIAQTTKYAWDATYHRPTTVTVVGDHQTTYAYGIHNRLASVTVTNLSSAVSSSDAPPRTTTFTYTTWPSGLVKKEVVDGPRQGTSDVITMTFSEQGDLLSKSNVLGQATTYGNYNGLGLPGYITGPNGAKRSFVYDTRGRVIDVQTHRNGGTQHTRYTYDGFGRVSSVTPPDGHTISYQYDVAGRLLAKFEPEGDGTYDETAYTYNAMSLPVTIKKQRVFAKPQQGTVQ